MICVISAVRVALYVCKKINMKDCEVCNKTHDKNTYTPLEYFFEFMRKEYCHVTLRYVMLCYVMLCYVMLCYVKLLHE
jgi:hypothetical protein